MIVITFFVVNFLDTVDSHFLTIPGVTSLSCDTHKNGWAPKGSSVCVMKDIADTTFGSVNLAYYAMFVLLFLFYFSYLFVFEVRFGPRSEFSHLLSLGMQSLDGPAAFTEPPTMLARSTVLMPCMPSSL